MGREAEIRRLAAELDSLLDSLRTSVDALTAIIVPPGRDGKEPAR